MTSIPRVALNTLLNVSLPDVEREIRVQQVIDLAKQTPIHAIGNLGNGVLLAWLFWDRLPHLAIAGWLGLFAAFSGVQLSRWWRKRNWPAPERVSNRAIQRTTGWAFFAGILWATAIVFAFPHDDQTLQLLILFLVGGLSAAAVASMAPQPIACLAFIGPPLLSVLVLLAAQMGSPVTRVITLMGGLYVVTLFAALFSGFSSFLAIVRSKIDSRALETRLLEMELEASTEANRAKTQFLANMSHELRTPLNAVIGLSEIIRDQSLGSDAMAQYRDYANDIHASGQNLLKIVNDVLDISRIEAGRLELDEGIVEIAPTTTASIKAMEQAARDAGVVLSTELPLDLPDLRADEFRLRQILIHLLSNAIKFSRRPGKAIIGAALRPEGSLAIWVKDDGIGMTEADVATAREPFRQVESSYSRKHDGPGLGLSLVQGFVTLHKGKLEIASVPAVGTTVTVVFPPERVIGTRIRPAEKAMRG